MELVKANNSDTINSDQRETDRKRLELLIGNYFKEQDFMESIKLRELIHQGAKDYEIKYSTIFYYSLASQYNGQS